MHVVDTKQFIRRFGERTDKVSRGNSIEACHAVERETEHQFAAARRPGEPAFGGEQGLARADHAPQDIRQTGPRRRDRAIEARLRESWRSVGFSPRSPPVIRTASQRIVTEGASCADS